jgi:5'-nucleotidase/UDP-sugar diphosphatase
MRPLFLLALAACTKSHDSDTEAPGQLRFTILHTNDTHSHMLGTGPNAAYSPDTTGDDVTLGGLSRLKALVDQIRSEKSDPVVLLDAGDWMAGTPFQLIATSDAAELQMMQDIGYDATTLGNHEFDWGPQILGDIIAKGTEKGVTVPIIASNTHPDPNDPGDDHLEALFTSGRIQTRMTITLDNGLVLGLFGILGDEAQTFAPAAPPTTFDTGADGSAAEIPQLQSDGADVIVGLTHNGIADDPAFSWDEQLANAVDGIDIIIGGHTHTPMFEAKVANGTTIVQAGSYGMWLGELDLVYDTTTDTLSVEHYELHPVDDSILGDTEAQAKIDAFEDIIESGPLAARNVSFADRVFETPAKVDFHECSESPIGNLVTDAYVAELNRLDPAHEVQVGFEAQGVLRESLYPGTQGFSDVFDVVPLGFGTDQNVADGYDLVDFYVTGKELRTACEVTSTVTPDFGCSYWIEPSGIRCLMNMSYFKASRTYEVDKWDGTAWVPIDISGHDSVLYHIVTESYIARLMYLMGDLSDHTLVIVPKDADGQPVDPSDRVFDRDPATPGLQDVKTWQALIDYGASFPDTDGDSMPDLPPVYLTPQGRVVGYQ